jgi:hypothetical protein
MTRGEIPARAAFTALPFPLETAMARSIVLRFDAQCFDCGAPLAAGSTARWFGKGRVSCCGSANGAAAPSSTPAPARVPMPPRMAPSALSSARPVAQQPAHAPLPPWLPSAELSELSARTGVPVESLSSGMRPEHVAILASTAPRQRLLVRLSSGARLIVPAEHCAHVVRCIEESMIDRCRDVALLADKFGEGGQ